MQNSDDIKDIIEKMVLNVSDDFFDEKGVSKKTNVIKSRRNENIINLSDYRNSQDEEIKK